MENTVTTTQVMWMLGFTGPNAKKVTSNWLCRNKVRALYRYPGKHGEYVYRRRDILLAQRRVPGRGRRTDIKKVREYMHGSEVARMINDLITENSDVIVIDEFGYPLTGLAFRVIKGRPALVAYFADDPIVAEGT